MISKPLAHRRRLKKSVLKLNQIKNYIKDEPTAIRTVTDTTAYVEESLFAIYEAHLESKREARANLESVQREVVEHRATKTKLDETKSLMRRYLEMGKQSDMVVEVYRVEICGFTHMNDDELLTRGFTSEVISWYREWNALKALLEEASKS